jgi:hypothetical protein
MQLSPQAFPLRQVLQQAASKILGFKTFSSLCDGASLSKSGMDALDCSGEADASVADSSKAPIPPQMIFTTCLSIPTPQAGFFEFCLVLTIH